MKYIRFFQSQSACKDEKSNPVKIGFLCLSISLTIQNTTKSHEPIFTKVNVFVCLTVRWAQISFEQKLVPNSIGSIGIVLFRISDMKYFFPKFINLFKFGGFIVTKRRHQWKIYRRRNFTKYLRAMKLRPAAINPIRTHAHMRIARIGRYM